MGLEGYYRKFVPNYITIAKPLKELMQADTTYVWTNDQQKAFQALKDALTSSPIIRALDFD